MSLVRPGLAMLVVALTGLLPTALPAQAPNDLEEMIVGWSEGRYASPVHCELDGRLVRGIRRVVIRPRRQPGRKPELIVQLIDMRPENATRCVDTLGRSQPNAVGKLVLRREGTAHAETARSDFKHMLRRQRGFEFDVVSGVLKLQTVSQPESSPTLVDHRGGRARIEAVAPATDAARELADFDSPKKRVLVIEPVDGNALRLPLFLHDLR